VALIQQGAEIIL